MPTSTLVQGRSDPLRNFKFQVQINHPNLTDLNHLGFMAVSGLQVSTEQIAYREGGLNTFTRKMPGQSDFPPVVMSRGMFVGNALLWDWFREIFYVGAGAGPVYNNQFRASIIIRVLPHPSATPPGGADAPVTQVPNAGVAAWKLHNAWPLSMSFGDLDAGGNGIIMEQMTFAHEGLEFTIASSTPGAVAHETNFMAGP